jgi:hypothetical protein
VPAQLRGLVTAVGGLDAAARWKHRAVPLGLTRGDLTAAYDVPPRGAGTGVTVASLQFSGWDRRDLAEYVRASGLPTPAVAEVPVAPGIDPTRFDGASGEFEVALDQQTLLATAPGAAQRIYFARNETDADSLAAYTRLADDAVAGVYDVLTISWGVCEDYLDPAVREALDVSLARIVAAGRTVFAASGDYGSYDCDEYVTSVDFPAASAAVVGVGGTRLARSGSTWTERAWTERSSDDPTGVPHASGGGYSKYVARPAWQPAQHPSDTPGAPKMRMVPDLSADADTASGLGVYVRSAGGWVIGGGTSMSAPIVAGHFAATLSTMGRRHGLGEPLHPHLYRNPAAFRDVVSGNNIGFQATTGYDLVTGVGTPLWNRVLAVLQGAPIAAAPATSRSLTIPVKVTAPAGSTFTSWQICTNSLAYSCATPRHASLATLPRSVTVPAGPSRAVRALVIGWVAPTAPGQPETQRVGAAYTRYDATRPVVTVAAAFTPATGTTATFSWRYSDAGTATSGLDKYVARLVKVGSTTAHVSYTGTRTSITSALARGAAYRLYVQAYDRAGNVSAVSATTVYVPFDQRDMTRSTGWTTSYGRADYRGSKVYSARRGAKLSKSVRGKYVDIMVLTGPTRGYVDVYVGATRVRRIDTYSSTYRHRQFRRAVTWTTVGTRTVSFVVVGARRSTSRGNYVTIDGLRVA